MKMVREILARIRGEYTLGGGITEERKTKQKEELGGGKWGGVV